jgi:hypothetical protein
MFKTHVGSPNEVATTFRAKIKEALLESLHSDPTPANYFIENFAKFQQHYERTEDWEKELAVREVYKGPLPFVWSEWDYGVAWPTMSSEYETNHHHVAHIEKLCVFIKEIEYYI